MEYKYEKTDQHYSDLASGRVLHSLAGHPAFPIRLASEIFARCLASREALYGTSNAAERQTIIKYVQPQWVDIVFTDVPYGQHSQWQDSEALSNPLWSMPEALTDILSPSSIVAVASDKGQKVSHEQYQRVEHFQIGKRRVVILKPA